MGHRRSNGRIDRQLVLNTLRCAHRGRCLRHHQSEQQCRQHDPAQFVKGKTHTNFRIRCPGAPSPAALGEDGCPRFAPAYPDFLLRSTRRDRVCGFRQGKPHGVRQRHQPRQEIRSTWDDDGLFPLLSQDGSTALTLLGNRRDSQLLLGKSGGGLRPSFSSHVRWGERGAPGAARLGSSALGLSGYAKPSITGKKASF